MREFRIIPGDSLSILRTLPAGSVHCCITSPPYWGLRDYGVSGQLGLEKTPEEYTARMVEVFREVRRVLRADGTLWLNLGDSYASNAATGTKIGGESYRGSSTPTLNTEQQCRVAYRGNGIKAKDLIGIPWRVAFALQADGWYLRSDIIWHKPNPMPESVTDRPTKAHEYLFLLTKRERYAYDAAAIAEASIAGWNGSTFDGERDLIVRPTTGRNRWQERKDAGEGSRRGFSQNAPTAAVSDVGIGETRNKRTVWTVATEPYREAHFAVMPTALVEPCVMAGCPEGGTVLDPFAGSGTVGVVALRHARNFIGCELNPAYVEMARSRITDDAPMFNFEATA